MWSEAQLDGAADHVGYEMQMVVAGALLFSQRNEGSYPPKVRDATIDDALLEATLLHLRLLDEFLSGRSTHGYAVKAKDWLGSNYSASCLHGTVMDLIDAQVAHVSVIRAPSQVWELARYALDCCRAFDRFLQRVAKENPARSPAFERARQHVQIGLAELPRWA